MYRNIVQKHLASPASRGQGPQEDYMYAVNIQGVNRMHLYPQTTTNRNVPKGAFLFAETSTANDEQHTTYYVDPNCFVWKVGDWIGDKPQHVYIFELCRLTGDTVNMLVARVQQKYSAQEN